MLIANTLSFIFSIKHSSWNLTSFVELERFKQLLYILLIYLLICIFDLVTAASVLNSYVLMFDKRECGSIDPIGC